MAISTIYGFDIFPPEMQTGAMSTFPVYGSGFLDTPFGIPLNPRSSGSSLCVIGASDVEEDYFRDGERQRALVAVKTAASNLFAYVNLGGVQTINRDTVLGSVYRHVIGFSFKDRSENDQPGYNIPIVRFERTAGTALTNQTLFGVGPTGEWIMPGAATGVKRVLNQEYYVEIVFETTTQNTSTTTQPVRVQVWIDGVLLGGRTNTIFNTTRSAAATWGAFHLGIVQPQVVDNKPLRFCFANIYTIVKPFNSTAADSYIERLGPQRVVTVPLKQETNNEGWTVEGAGSSVEALSPQQWNESGVRIVSPNDDGEVQFSLDVPTYANSIVHLLRFFGRHSRSADGPRGVTYSLDRNTGENLMKFVGADAGVLDQSRQIGNRRSDPSQPLTTDDLRSAAFTIQAPTT